MYKLTKNIDVGLKFLLHNYTNNLRFPLKQYLLIDSEVKQYF